MVEAAKSCDETIPLTQMNFHNIIIRMIIIMAH